MDHPAHGAGPLSRSTPGNAGTRIVLLMKNRENCRLLAEWLGTRFEVLIPDDRELPTEPFDLCIIDGPTLEARREEVMKRKLREGPAFLPFLFVTTRKDLRMVTHYLYECIDELIFMPIEKVELQARLEILLRARRSSRELKQHGEELFSALVQQSLVGVYLARDGQYVYFNQAGAQAFGYSPAELTHQMGPLDLTHPDDHPLMTKHLRTLDKGQAESTHFTFRGLRKNGSVVNCELFEQTITHEGRPVRLGTILDITERHMLEDERAKRQQDRIETLQRADQLKDQFLSILSHELRTPIHAITGFGSVLDDEVVGPLTERQHTYLRKMIGGADVLLALVNDLLDMSRIHAGKFTVTPLAFDFAEVAEFAKGSLQPLWESKHQQVTLELAAGLPHLLADRQRIAQVLINLLGNAIKFTPDHGRITLTARCERDHLLCEVSDNGPGIKGDDLPLLFQRFTQLDMSATRRVGGTGLGLSICKAIVDAHSGTIGVRSELSKGSTFWLTIPLGGNDGEPPLPGT